MSVLALACTIGAKAQLRVTDPLPHENPVEAHYLFPINPGQTGLLAGTMGELRSTHFHAGIDIRTNNVEGLPVRAAQDGYISRAWISTYGYGKALFIRHPDGNTTVYAHLSALKGALGDSVRSHQYRHRSFETDIFFPPEKFKVKAGDTIAFSGNTGGSGGPHLHFEIRDSSNEALNPLSFGFTEIKDGAAPVAQKIALKTLDINSRINDRFGRFEFYLYRVGNAYTFSQPIIAKGRIGIEILAYDRMDHSGFRCGINHIEMSVDSQRVFSQDIDKINFTESRHILTLMDYRTLKTSGLRYNKLYVDDASRLPYQVTTDNGVVVVEDKFRAVRILLRDTYGNTSTVRFDLKPLPVSTDAQWLDVMTVPFRYEVLENTLVIAAKPCPGDSGSLKLFEQHVARVIKPAYRHPNQVVYLVDVRGTMPDSVQTCQGVLHFENQDLIPSGTDYKYFSDWADIRFSPGALYDSTYFTLSKTERNNQEVFTVGDANVPLNGALDITLKPGKVYPPEASVYKVNGSIVYLGGTWKGGRIRFQTPELGNFVILRDSVAPAYRRLLLNSQSARFRILDDLSGIDYFEATVNGEWLLMNYDYKTGILQSERLDKTKALKGDFQLKIVDNAGNERIFHQKIP